MTPGRWELLRALGAFADNPGDAATVSRVLGLPAPGRAEHTEAFVLNCPPYASVYLGPDGAIGGEGADRVAGFWRAAGVSPPAEPDHLAALLSLYAHLGEAAGGPGRAAAAAALAHRQAALLWEHLWSWLPGYLDAVHDLAAPALSAWADLVSEAVHAELRAHPAPARLPLALRASPGIPGHGQGPGDLAGALTIPVRSGIILTRRRLADGAGQAGLGHRIGERRFALRAMLEQDARATLGWLSGEAGRWQRRQAGRPTADAVSGWWAARAGRTAEILRHLASRPPAPAPAAAIHGDRAPGGPA